MQCPLCKKHSMNVVDLVADVAGQATSRSQDAR